MAQLSRLTLPLILALLFPALVHAGPMRTGIFGLWAWGDWDDAFRIVSEQDFDLAVGVSSRKMLDLAHSRGLKCIVDHGLTREIAEDEKKWQAYLSGLQERVTKLKDHPATFAWYLVDEPDWNEVPVDRLRIAVETVRSLDDKGHPIFTVLTSPEKWEPYLPLFDIIAVDPYLKRKGPGGRPEQPDKVRDYLTRVREDLQHLNLERSVYVVLGAFQQIPRSNGIPVIFRTPTAEEFMQMVDIAIKERVDGILVWTLAFRNNPRYLDWKLPHAPLWDTVKKLPTHVHQEERPSIR